MLGVVYLGIVAVGFVLILFSPSPPRSGIGRCQSVGARLLDLTCRALRFSRFLQEKDDLLIVSRFSGVFLLIMYVQLLIFQVSRGLLDDNAMISTCAVGTFRVCVFHIFSSTRTHFNDRHQLWFRSC